MRSAGPTWAAGVKCRYGTRCNRPDCWFKHPADASAALVGAFSEMSLHSGAAVSTAGGAQRLLDNFRDMFKVDHKFMVALRSRLESPTSKMCLIFVDLDNVPRFFEKVTKDMLNVLPMECFIVCSARSTNATRWVCSGNKVHFSLAMPTKDAADAVCTVASAKLDSIVRIYGRQNGVPILIASDDKIFQQVTALLNEGGSAAYNLSRQQVMAGARMLQQVAEQARCRTIQNGHKWECDDCGRTFGSERALEQHCEDMHHWESDSWSCSDDEWECDACGKVFGSERALEQHCNDTWH